MKNILMVSYCFPPMQAPESIRSFKYAKFLKEQGFKVSILTAGEGDAEVKGIKIYKAKTKENKFLRGMAYFKMIKDPTQLWVKNARAKLAEILKNDKIDLIISRSMPVTSHFPLIDNPDTKEIPWFAEFSDPWTQSIYIKYPIPFMKKFDEKIEEKIMNQARKVIVTSKRTEELFLNKYPQLKGKSITIPNFFDASEFNIGARKKEDNRFLIIHAGNFYGIRSPEPLFKALRLLEEEQRDKIKVQLIGSIGKFKDLIEKYELTKTVELVSTVPRSDIFSYLNSADSLLVVDAPSKEPSVFLPTKLCEYLYLNKPILAISPEGTTKDIILKAKAGLVAAPENVEKIKENLIKILSFKRNASDEVEKYSIATCLNQLKELVDKEI